DNHPTDRLAQASDKHDISPVQIDAQFVSRHIVPGDMEVAQEERQTHGVALKRDTDLLPHQAVRAVAADQPRCPDRLGLSVRVPKERLHPVLLLAAGDEFQVTLDLSPYLGEMLDEKSLRLALRQKQQIGIAAVDGVESELQDRLTRAEDGRLVDFT